LTIKRSTIRDKRGVTEIGRKSESSLGFGTLGTGVIIAFFQSNRTGGQKVNIVFMNYFVQNSGRESPQKL